MDRFQELTAFVAVTESGGFAKAAARLGSSPPAITRMIASLEARLGVQLFNRTTRNVHLTDAGLRFAERARAVLGALEAAESEARGQSSVPSGHFTLTASVTMGRSLLSPIVNDFLKAHPRVSAKLLLLDRVVNIVEEGVDVALRVGHLPDSSLISVKLGAAKRILVASPNYLAKRGVPREPNDLKSQSIIAFTGLMPDRKWVYGDGKRARGILLEPRLEINDAVSAIASAVEGEGITICLSYMVADRIASGALVEVLSNYAPPSVLVQLVYPESRLVAPKIRAFIDFSAPRLRAAFGELSLRKTKSEKFSTRFKRLAD